MTEQELRAALANADGYTTSLDREVAALEKLHPDTVECVLMGPMGQSDVMPLGRVLAFANDNYDAMDYLSLRVSLVVDYVRIAEEMEAARQKRLVLAAAVGQVKELIEGWKKELESDNPTQRVPACSFARGVILGLETALVTLNLVPVAETEEVKRLSAPAKVFYFEADPELDQFPVAQLGETEWLEGYGPVGEGEDNG